MDPNEKSVSEPTHDKTAVAELPRLRIHHFFVLTTVFAVVMTFYHLVLPSSEILPAFFDIRVSISAFLQSIAITICGLGMYWLWRGARFFSEVGHWLLLISALGFLYGIATWFAMWGGVSLARHLNARELFDEHIVRL